MGLRIGKGETLKDIQGTMTAVAEGVLTSRSAHMLSKKLGVEVARPPPPPLSSQQVFAVQLTDHEVCNMPDVDQQLSANIA